MLRMNELLSEFNISRPTAYAWMAKGMPAYRAGRLLYFDKKEVQRWLKKSKNPSKSDLIEITKKENHDES